MIITIYLYKNDLPDNFELSGDLAIDTEAMGLNNHRDRLCVLQFSNGNNDAYLVHFDGNDYSAPNLKKLLLDKNRVKIIHFARFDLAIIYHYLQISLENIYCTKIASKIARTYTDGHGLKDLCKELLGISLSKAQQLSDWGSHELSNEQKEYAASDVLYLHKIKGKLDQMLIRENRADLAQNCFNFLITRIKLDLSGWPDDIFVH